MNQIFDFTFSTTRGHQNFLICDFQNLSGRIRGISYTVYDIKMGKTSKIIKLDLYMGSPRHDTWLLLWRRVLRKKIYPKILEWNKFLPTTVLWISVIEFENPIVTILRWIIFFVMNFGGKFENIYFWWVNYER